jgi:hypothetical protein
VTAIEQNPPCPVAPPSGTRLLRIEEDAQAHPIAVGKGMRLFDEGDSIPLKILSSHTFETGVLHLVYARADAPGAADYDEAKAHLPQT